MWGDVAPGAARHLAGGGVDICLARGGGVGRLALCRLWPMLLLLPPDPHTCALVASDLPAAVRAVAGMQQPASRLRVLWLSDGCDDRLEGAFAAALKHDEWLLLLSASAKPAPLVTHRLRQGYGT